jgi:hypothetical protein
MRRHKYLESALIILLLAAGLPDTIYPQSRAYAKFGSNGETVGLYNLMSQSNACGDRKVFEGGVSNFNSWRHGMEIDYRFAIDVGGGQRLFEFTLGVDDISRADIRDLISRSRRVRIRACRSRGRYWAAEEVTRANAQ